MPFSGLEWLCYVKYKVLRQIEKLVRIKAGGADCSGPLLSYLLLSVIKLFSDLKFLFDNRPDKVGVVNIFTGQENRFLWVRSLVSKAQHTWLQQGQRCPQRRVTAKQGWALRVLSQRWGDLPEDLKITQDSNHRTKTCAWAQQSLCSSLGTHMGHWFHKASGTRTEFADSFLSKLLSMLKKKNSKKRTSCQALSISDTKIDGNIRTTSRDEPHLLFKEINENWCHDKKKKRTETSLERFWNRHRSLFTFPCFVMQYNKKILQTINM